jgi:polyisoprenoid-binding protein YceI
MTDAAARRATVLSPGEYSLAPGESTVRFQVGGLTGPVTATMPARSGTFSVDERGHIVAATLVLDPTGIDGRGPIVGALRGSGGFYVERFRAITFVSTVVTMTPPRFEAAGDLTIRDVTQRITFAGEVTRARPHRFVATIAGSIDRTLFGITVGRPLYRKIGEVRMKAVAAR